MAPPPRARPLRRSLAACTSEGVSAELVVALAGGAATTAWALHLGCGARVVGFLGALPFLAQVLQPAGAWLTSRLGARRAALVTVLLSRQAFLPLVALPWLPLDAGGKRALLLACCAAHHGLGVLCNNAWVTWFGELVPARVRGRYFGRRTAICTVASAVATLAVGITLDRSRAAELREGALAALSAAACAAGAASVALMARQAGGRGTPAWTAEAALRPLGDARARRLVAYLVLWNAAIGFSAPFFGLYLLQDLGFGYGALAATTALYALARTATAPAWGRLVDRAGARRVLVACTSGLALGPLAWAAAGHLGPWPIALDALLGGALLGGHGVATFTLPLALSPRRERPHYHAAFSLAGGAAFGVASACGGALVAAGPRLLGRADGAFLPMHLTFAASLALRVAAAGASVAVVDGAAPGAARTWRRWSATPRGAWVAVRRGAWRTVPAVLRVGGFAAGAGPRAATRPARSRAARPR